MTTTHFTGTADQRENRRMSSQLDDLTSGNHLIILGPAHDDLSSGDSCFVERVDGDRRVKCEVGTTRAPKLKGAGSGQQCPIPA